MYSSVRGMAELMNLVNTKRELFGESWGTGQIHHYTDASANKAIVMRRGAGALKHVEAKHIWIHEAVRRYGVQIHRVPRADLHAHILASPSRAEELKEHMSELFGFTAPG